ncbi:hypothetical protein A2U01_0039464 [Trifolium medium]|uniref:Uncharacterized protein n=1 Tax=Trifolium medium TaxID=97028 RepID=A0A392Q3K8_9FABA|nr:hypothetical protein [Trifolium medium]
MIFEWGTALAAAAAAASSHRGDDPDFVSQDDYEEELVKLCICT